MATPTRIGPDLFSGVLDANVKPRRSEPGEAEPTARHPVPETLTFKVVASARIGDQMVERGTKPAFGSSASSVLVTSPPDLTVRVEPMTAAIEPGQELKFTVTIERRNGFVGRVPVDVLNLPHGLRVLDVGLSGVLINENEVSRSFVVACDPWAEPGTHLFYAAPKVEAENERHASAPLKSARSPPRGRSRWRGSGSNPFLQYPCHPSNPCDPWLKTAVQNTTGLSSAAGQQ